MKGFLSFMMAVSLLLVASMSTHAAVPCTFDKAKTCELQRDILNDKGTNGLKYYAPTNYDHRMSGEINVYDATLTVPYTDGTNAPGQIKFLGNKINAGFWKTGEIMTRANSNLPPFNAPVKSNPWTTQEAKHGYLEVIVKMPGCDQSADGLCQNGTAPNNYRDGLWPAIWMMPTNDAKWPDDGEIDISEAYLRGSDYKTSTTTLHFNGNDGRCTGGDCVGAGFPLPNLIAARPLWNDFHIWGFEWEPDPNSANGGILLSGYFDNVKVWGPFATDSLPADGPNALRRGFNNPNGGYYLIVNLAIGGPYAGAPNPQLTNSSMYVQSVKAYTVNGGVIPPHDKVCKPPENIQSMYSPDKKQLTIAWTAPADSMTIKRYAVADWQKREVWRGKDAKVRVFQDQSLPGQNGNFTYFLQTICSKTSSPFVQYDVQVKLKK